MISAPQAISSRQLVHASVGQTFLSASLKYVGATGRSPVHLPALGVPKGSPVLAPPVRERGGLRGKVGTDLHSRDLSGTRVGPALLKTDCYARQEKRGLTCTPAFLRECVSVPRFFRQCLNHLRLPERLFSTQRVCPQACPPLWRVFRRVPDMSSTPGMTVVSGAELTCSLLWWGRHSCLPPCILSLDDGCAPCEALGLHSFSGVGSHGAGGWR
jgi:hypothetical protein